MSAPILIAKVEQSIFMLLLPEAAEMDRRSHSIPWAKAVIGAAFLAIAVMVVHSANAQDSFTLEPDDGYSPLTRSEVIEVQQVLTRLGYYVGPIDGIVGGQTAAAAKTLAGLLEQDFVRRPSGQGIVLNYEIEEGAPQGYRSTQIMIDEHRKIVIYDFQLPATGGDHNPIRLAGRGYVDLSMKISLSNDKMIMANNTSGALVITKHDGKFVRSFVNPFPLKDGNWVALGNALWGKCAKSPFG